LREEGLGLLDGVSEAIQICEKAEIPVVLTHHKVMGKPMWGSSDKSLNLIKEARNKGLDVMADQYPYAASHTGIGILIPSWARAGGNGKYRERIANSVLRDSIKKEIIFNILNDRGGADLRRIQFSKVTWQPELEGKTLHDWCEMEGLEPNLDNGADLVIRAQFSGGASCIFHAMSEDDVINIMKYEYTAIASDGRLSQPGDGSPHPRCYGTFPRVLGKYVREENVLTLPDAIRKMTELPASRLGLVDRGLIKKNFIADITIFNPETISETGDFTNPHNYPIGIEHVIINGQFAVRNGEFLNARNGKVLYGPGKS
jgi:dihydroorotase/N-acyl-D-amino-acid deacylase